MGLAGKYTALIDQIITTCKTITPELTDDTTVNGGTRVFKWNKSRSPRKTRYEVEVKAGPMLIKGGKTTLSSDNEFQIILDLIYYSDAFETGFDSVMGVAEKIYDKFHITTINGNCRNATVEIFPGDGQFSGRSLLAIPIRIVITCDRVISQT